MKTNLPRQLDQFIHDINSKSGSLKSAALLLKTASSQEGEELLKLMAEQSRDLAQIISGFQTQRSQRRP